MGTRADFYVGIGPDAEWIGSQAMDGYISAIPGRVIDANDEDDFREQVAAHLSSLSHATWPKDGWPWPWVTSATTDCSYWFHAGVVFSEIGGYLIRATVDRDGGLTDDERDEPETIPGAIRASFPDMTDKQNVTFGHRSGMLTFAGPGR